MKPDQQKYLFDRLRDSSPNRTECKLPKQPREVTVARRVVAQWERRRHRIRQTWHKRQMKLYGKVTEIIHSGDFVKALAAVKAFEKVQSK